MVNKINTRKKEFKYLDKVRVFGFYSTKFTNGAYILEEERMDCFWIGGFKSKFFSFLVGKYEIVSKKEVLKW